MPKYKVIRHATIQIIQDVVAESPLAALAKAEEFDPATRIETGGYREPVVQFDDLAPENAEIIPYRWDGTLNEESAKFTYYADEAALERLKIKARNELLERAKED